MRPRTEYIVPMASTQNTEGRFCNDSAAWAAPAPTPPPTTVVTPPVWHTGTTVHSPYMASCTFVNQQNYLAVLILRYLVVKWSKTRLPRFSLLVLVLVQVEHK